MIGMMLRTSSNGRGARDGAPPVMPITSVMPIISRFAISIHQVFSGPAFSESCLPALHLFPGSPTPIAVRITLFTGGEHNV